ncbi:MAG: phosphoribosylglycinamide formyltransferase [Thermoleophilia bacterium]|nr:phosphoribosylglycinamide formyltransferase [Thermoleophilia bacterium]
MIGVLVSGSGSNLQALIDAGLPVVAVASNRADAGALARAEAHGIPTGVFPLAGMVGREARDAAMADWLARHGATLVVCAGFMQLLGPSFLARFPERVVNVHPALLPAFPGEHAVEAALTAGVSETGATVHLVDLGIDTGPVLRQEAVPVLPGDTVETLHARIRSVEHRLLPAAVQELLAR